MTVRFRPLADMAISGHPALMRMLRLLKVVSRHLAWQLAALLGALGYVLLSNSLPDIGGQLLAGLLLLTIMALLIYRFVRVVRDPVGSITWRPDD